MRYALLIRLALPLFFVFAWWRGRHEPAWREAWRERRGEVPITTDRPLWIHAASVGEVNSAAGLLREIQLRWPDLPLLLTAFTPTGLDRLRELAPRATHSLLPLDFPRYWRRFFDRADPRALVVLETECWPNMLKACHQANRPVLWLSARLGESSSAGMPRLFGRSLLNQVLKPVRAFAAQTEQDAQRFQALGAPAANIKTVGSLKQDLQIDPKLRSQASSWRAQQGRGSMWLAASTHAGEELVAITAHKALLKRDEQALLLLAPRHPRRADELEALLLSQGLRLARRSQTDETAEADVYLIDTLGELLFFYAACDFCFVGGSLVEIGGHNLLEPAALARAMLTGPNLHSCQRDASALAQRGALKIVQDANELQAAVVSLAEDGNQRVSAGAAAEVYAKSQGGALARSLELLAPLLDQPATSN